MKIILIFFILFGSLVYGDPLEDIKNTIDDQHFLQKVEKPISYNEKLLKELDFSSEKLKKSFSDELTLGDHIKDIENPIYTRWAYKVGEEVVILSVASGSRRDTSNYVFRNEGGTYKYMGNYFSGDYTTGLTFIKSDGEAYIINYHIDESNKKLLTCEVYNEDLKKIGGITRSGINYEIIEEAAILSYDELLNILENQEKERFVLGNEKYGKSLLERSHFLLDYNNDSKLDEIYLKYYQSETYNTLDELRIEFSNQVVDSYFKKALGRVAGMKLFMVKDKVYMAFLEKEAFYTDRNYGNYIRIFLAEETEITEVARFEYREEYEYEIERM